jgi:hypothetical protein
MFSINSPWIPRGRRTKWEGKMPLKNYRDAEIGSAREFTKISFLFINFLAIQ